MVGTKSLSTLPWFCPPVFSIFISVLKKEFFDKFSYPHFEQPFIFNMKRRSKSLIPTFGLDGTLPANFSTFSTSFISHSSKLFFILQLYYIYRELSSDSRLGAVNLGEIKNKLKNKIEKK